MPFKKLISKRGQKKAVIDSKAIFEKLLKNTDAIQHYQLRLYITGTTSRSAQAIANIRSLCEEYLTGHYDLEVIDIYQQPTEAAKEQIIAAPTLVKELPTPPRRLIGDLSNRGKVILGLNLTGKSLLTKKAAEKTQWAKL
jgi:circadian clock protein KaiB